MEHHLARRLEGLVQSPIRAMSRACERANGINLGQGICDLPTPIPVREGAVRAIEDRRSIYSKFEGIDRLRQAIARKMAADNGIACDPDTEVMVAVGSATAFTCALLAVMEPGEEIVLFEPYYGYHLNAVTVLGGTPKFVTLTPPDWTVPESALAAAVTGRTKAIVVNTPANPSGKVFTREELERIGTLCVERDLLLITDEVYEYILFDGRPHVSPASLPGLRERTITLNSVSKTFSITGWRIGYAVAPATFIHPMGLINDLITICAPTPLQHGVAAGLETLGSGYYRGLAVDYQAKRDRLVAGLEAGGFTVHSPQGAYYLLADFSRHPWPDDHAAAAALLERARVAAVPGSAFYRGAPGHRLLRFCFAKEADALDEAARRLAALRP